MCFWSKTKCWCTTSPKFDISIVFCPYQHKKTIIPLYLFFYNLFDIYLPIADNVLILDNSFSKSSLIAKKGINDELEIIDDYKFNQIKFFYD